MVTLSDEPRPGTGAATDAAGRWSISGTLCVQVRPTATRAGYGPVNGEPVQLISGTPLVDLKIALMPEGSIVGRVQNAGGDPIAHAYVDVKRASVHNGRRTMNGDVSARTDSEGNFRIGGLVPGSYIVCATSTDLTYPVGGGGASVYMEDCFPGPATAMEIRGREVRTSLTLRTAPALHVRGKISGLPLIPSTEIQMAQWPGDPLRDQTADEPPHLMTFLHNARTASDGSFDIAAVPPGVYRAEALVPDPRTANGMLLAETRVDVGATDVDNVTLPLNPFGSVNGKVRFEMLHPSATPAGAASPAFEMNAGLFEAGTGFDFTEDAEWDARHLSFTIPRVPPGQYLLDLSLKAAEGIRVKSATMNGQDVLTQPISVNGAAGPVEIVLSDDTSDVNVTVTDAGGNPVPGQVILIAGESQPTMIQTSPDGHATKHGVPAGEYKAWAFDDISNVPWAEDDWMTQNAGPAQKVTVTLGNTASVTLTRIVAPQ